MKTIEKPVIHFKVSIVGSSSAGKSSLLSQLQNEMINIHHVPTVGVNTVNNKITFQDCTVKVEFWDLAGQEVFYNVAPVFYRQTQAIIVVYDLTRPHTTEETIKWVKQIVETNPATFIALVGNKCDVAPLPLMKLLELKHKVSELKTCAHYLTSAKTGVGVREMFADVILNAVIHDLKSKKDV